MVFHTPPDEAATKYSLGLEGFTAKSEMRPEVTAGPTERNVRAPKASALIEGAGAAAVDFF